MDIIYTNISGQIITEAQSKSLDFFYKIILYQEKIFEKYEFRNSILRRVTHYLKDEEIEIDVVARLNDLSLKNWVIIIKRNSTFNNYIVEDRTIYKDKIVIGKNRRLYIENENYYLIAGEIGLICTQSIDLSNGESITVETTKFYYFMEEEEDGFVPHFKATYNEEGSVSLITYYDVYDLDDHKGGRTIYGAEDAAKFRFLLPENPDYYLDATFEPF